MSRFDEIGMSQRVRLEWLEQTAQLVLAGLTRTAIEAELKALLHNRLSIGGSAVRGNREKVITILIRTWVDVDADLVPLRDDGLELLRSLPLDQHLPVHWGMVMAAYPLWAVVAETVGRLLRLQGTASAAEVQRRVRELRGERETVARAARRVLRAFNDWGVLVDTPPKGTYLVAQPRPIDDRQLAAFLIEALLRTAPAGSALLSALVNSSALFSLPITFQLADSTLNHKRLELLLQASGDRLVSLR